MFLSIIIPMYKVEMYIERCLLSCVHQAGTLLGKDYEIVCINDGSPDRSAEIASNFANCHAGGIHVINQINQGLSVARNSGLQIAKGDYVWFVDSDDWIEENCLSEIITICYRQKLDVLRICAANIVEGKPHRRFSVRNENTISSGLEEMRRGIPACAPFNIYRREFLNMHKLRFFPKIFHEDNEFTPRVFYYAERVGCLNKVLYYVYQSPNSITRSINVQKPLSLIQVMRNLVNFTENITKDAKPLFHNLIGSALNSAMRQTILMSKREQELVERKLADNRDLYSHLLRSTYTRYWIEGLFLKIFPKNPLLIYKLLNLYKKNDNPHFL